MVAHTLGPGSLDPGSLETLELPIVDMEKHSGSLDPGSLEPLGQQILDLGAPLTDLKNI